MTYLHHKLYVTNQEDCWHGVNFVNWTHYSS